MEYINYHGSFADIPVDKILAGWKAVYGHKRVGQWIASFEQPGGELERDFTREDIVNR